MVRVYVSNPLDPNQGHPLQPQQFGAYGTRSFPRFDTNDSGQQKAGSFGLSPGGKISRYGTEHPVDRALGKIDYLHNLASKAGQIRHQQTQEVHPNG